MSKTASRPGPEEAQATRERAVAAASVTDAKYLLKKAQRALASAKAIAGKYTDLDDEPAQEEARRILDLCGHVDTAVALAEGE